MELNEAIPELKKVLANSQHTKGCDCKECTSLRCVISFCETALKLQGKGMPQKKEYPKEHGTGGNECHICSEITGWNSCHDAWTAWLVSKVNIEKIIKAMDSIKYQNNWQGATIFDLGETMTDGDIQRIAETIVASILGKGK